ncbi:C-type lectin domain family 4 member E-like isoform X1 [Gymnodraco acuticeps]|uniref:C-type lectin domain family 4 member E-like isoform X1 n=1 Tax=Gymnodraco acuticeps TaxID=8218 RepID=A0A6P8TT20_GYMAC|nr:C-type lectin domain family 4 member E-like isoform X1 [Gymnodraco acuticeps]
MTTTRQRRGGGRFKAALRCESAEQTDGAGQQASSVKKKLPPESKLSVELQEEKGKPTEGNSRLYRAACLFLTIICLVLLLVVIILSLKLQTGSTICPEREGTTADERRSRPSDSTCSHEKCEALFPEMQPQHSSCRQCPGGWLRYGPSCFYLSTFRLSWEESRRNCSFSGGSLAVITNRGLQYYLTKVGKLSYWIGLRQIATTWTWEDKTELTESYWQDGGSTGGCGSLSSDKPAEKNWRKVPCGVSTYFICQL